jgi:hypothetical protein
MGQVEEGAGRYGGRLMKTFSIPRIDDSTWDYPGSQTCLGMCTVFSDTKIPFPMIYGLPRDFSGVNNYQRQLSIL